MLLHTALVVHRDEPADERIYTDAVLGACMRHWTALAPLHRWLTDNVQGAGPVAWPWDPLAAGIAYLLNCIYAESMAVDNTLRALANPTRRAMLELVWDAERTSSEIAEAVGATRPAASQHLKVLREAGLVRVRADGSQRLYRVDSERLAEVRAALERFWGARLGRLSTAVAADRKQGPAGGTL